MTTPSKRIEHRFTMSADKKCIKCGGKFKVTGVIKSITRRKTCPDCKKKNIKKNNDKSNGKNRSK